MLLSVGFAVFITIILLVGIYYKVLLRYSVDVAVYGTRADN